MTALEGGADILQVMEGARALAGKGYEEVLLLPRRAMADEILRLDQVGAGRVGLR